jgi:hypothetical protein
MSPNVSEPTVLFLVTRRFADRTELNKNMQTKYTAKAKVLSMNGEKSNIEIMTLYKGVIFSPGMNADFVMKAGIHNISAIMTMTRCCAKKLCLKKFNISYSFIKSRPIS